MRIQKQTKQKLKHIQQLIKEVEKELQPLNKTSMVIPFGRAKGRMGKISGLRVRNGIIESTVTAYDVKELDL